MKVARVSFVADYDGERIPIHRGRTRIADDHELAERFPERFERATDGAVRDLGTRSIYRLANGQAWYPPPPEAKDRN